MTPKWGHIDGATICSAIQGELISGAPETFFSGLSTDSRNIKPGQLFWALKGERYDGHEFVKQAVDKGAAGVVVGRGSRPKMPDTKAPIVIVVPDTLKALGDLGRWWRHEFPIPVVAITGSVGKTTTKEMAASILGLEATTLKNEGNLNNLIGLPLTLLSLEKDHQRAVLEMGMNQPGEIYRLTEIADPDVGLITSVARAHLEGLGDIEAIARAKVELVKKISEEGLVVLNGDDALLMRTASPYRRDPVTYGLSRGNKIRGRNIVNLGREGISFELQYSGRARAVRLRVPGLQNVLNALAASAIAVCLEEPAHHIVEGLNRFEGVKGRFMMITLAEGVTLVDDTYNSNPASLKAALDSVKALVTGKGRTIVGLAEMMELGDETVPAHLEAGTMVAEIGAAYFAAIGEHAREMIAGAVSSGFPPDCALVVDSHQEMIEAIGSKMRAGDVVLLKGSRKMRLETVVEALVETKS